MQIILNFTIIVSQVADSNTPSLVPVLVSGYLHSLRQKLSDLSRRKRSLSRIGGIKHIVTKLERKVSEGARSTSRARRRKRTTNLREELWMVCIFLDFHETWQWWIGFKVYSDLMPINLLFGLLFYFYHVSPGDRKLWNLNTSLALSLCKRLPAVSRDINIAVSKTVVDFKTRWSDMFTQTKNILFNSLQQNFRYL